MSKSPLEKRIGLLGGGQLGRMLMQPTIDMNLELHVMDKDPNAPCRGLASSFTQGDLMDADAVFEFGKDKDVITIEIEHVSADGLERLEELGKEVYPSAKVLRIIQDKGLQKQFYAKNGIPSSAYALVDGIDELKDQLQLFPCFQKLRQFGYDGKGVQRLNSLDDLSKAFEAPSVLEKLVDLEKELSVIVARGIKGEIRCFPLVELVFDPALNLVDHLISPANVSDEIAEQAELLATRVAKAFDCPGLFAVEMFLTKDGELLVNETAPRTHNSGHHTIEANHCSQFEQQIRAVIGLPLGDPSITTAAVMVNLIGAAGHSGQARYIGVEEVLSTSGAHLHLYGKKETRPGRKMGHLTICGSELESMVERAKELKEILKIES